MPAGDRGVHGEKCATADALQTGQVTDRNSSENDMVCTGFAVVGHAGSPE
jgi:hypothetical protein